MIFQSASSTSCNVGNLEEISPVIAPISQSAVQTYYSDNDNMKIYNMEILRMRIENLERTVESLCQMFYGFKYQDLSIDEQYGDWV